MGLERQTGRQKIKQGSSVERQTDRQTVKNPTINDDVKATRPQHKKDRIVLCGETDRQANN